MSFPNIVETYTGKNVALSKKKIYNKLSVII